MSSGQLMVLLDTDYLNAAANLSIVDNAARSRVLFISCSDNLDISLTGLVTPDQVAGILTIISELFRRDAAFYFGYGTNK